MDPIFEVHDLDDVTKVINSDMLSIQAAEDPPKRTQHNLDAPQVGLANLKSIWSCSVASSNSLSALLLT